MKKRIFASTCAACCLLALAGCGASGADGKTDSAAGEATGWTDGTYTETATGKNGDFEVTVVIQDGNIASVRKTWIRAVLPSRSFRTKS